MTYPDQFKFKHDNTSVTYCMQKVNYDGEYAWLCTREEDGYASGNPDIFARYYEDQITSNLNREFWTMVYPEPELVFPFTFNSLTGTIPCRAEKLPNGKIKISWGGNSTVRYTVDEIREQIKSGEWIVTSVGEQGIKIDMPNGKQPNPIVMKFKTLAGEEDYIDPAEKAYWNFDARKKGYGEWAGCPQSERDAFKAEHRKVNKPVDVSSIKVKVDDTDIEDATRNMNLLAQAVENVNISLESMQALLKEIGQGGRSIIDKPETDYKVQYKYLDEFQ